MRPSFLGVNLRVKLEGSRSHKQPLVQQTLRRTCGSVCLTDGSLNRWMDGRASEQTSERMDG